jgi:nitrogenase molybdenum-iron protein beta chain
MAINSKKKNVNNDTPQEVIEAPRYGCSLSGVYESTVGLNKAIPILHSGPGCGISQLHGASYAGGQTAPGDYGGTSTPCTCLVEEHVVFGGEEKLRDLIDSTLKISTAELFVVISGCVPSLIGDDVDAIVEEFRDKAPIIHVNAPGFSGNSYHGYELFFEALADQLLTAKPKQKRLVNILGIVPFQHIFWKGDLAIVKDLLKNIGVEANILFTEFDVLEKIDKIPAAEYNIVLSPWVGHRAAKKLEEKFKTPFISFSGVPIGPKQTSEFLREIKKALKLRSKKVEEYIAEEERKVYRLMEYAGDNLLFDIPHAYFAIVADSNIAINLTKFLINEVGHLPDIIQITDNPPEEYKEHILQELINNKEIRFTPDVIFEADSYEIKENLKDRPFMILYGSSLEAPLTESFDSIQLTITFPSYNRLVLRDSYAGYFGGTHLVENVRSIKLGPL